MTQNLLEVAGVATPMNSVAEKQEPTAKLQMNRSSLRNNGSKFKDLGEITDEFRGICRIFLGLVKKTEIRQLGTCWS